MGVIQGSGMSALSRNKGAAGERELAHLLTERLGRTVTRRLNQCRDGGYDLGPLPVALEVKRVKSASGKRNTWWKQACEQAALAGLPPALAFRVDGSRWTKTPWRFYLDSPATGQALDIDGFCERIRAL